MQQQRAPKKHEQPIQHDQDGAPIIVKVANHLATLDRMVRFRAQALVEQGETPQVLFYYAKEKSALQVSIAALRYHRAVIQGMPQPLSVLRRLVEAYEDGEKGSLAEIVEQARGLLLTYPAGGEMVVPENDYPENE